MIAVHGLIALGLVMVLYFFVSASGALWPGGPQLQPEAARNLSISLLLVGILLCGLLSGDLAQSIRSTLEPPAIGGGAGPQDEIEHTATPQAGAATETGGLATPAVDATPDRAEATSTSTARVAPSAAATTAAAPGPPPTPEPIATQPAATDAPTPGPTSTAIPTALPLEPAQLVATVLRAVIERANDAEVDAILSGQAGDVDPWWSGPARDRVLLNVLNVRSRFVEVTEVTWTPAGEGIRLLSSTAMTATYTTSETWTFVGTTGETCSDGSPAQRRFVETYPSEQYALLLRDGVYSVVEWQLGDAVLIESRVLCP